MKVELKIDTGKISVKMITFSRRTQDLFFAAGSALIGGMLVMFLQYYAVPTLPPPNAKRNEESEDGQDETATRKTSGNTAIESPPRTVRQIAPPAATGFADSFVKGERSVFAPL